MSVSSGKEMQAKSFKDINCTCFIYKGEIHTLFTAASTAAFILVEYPPPSDML